MSPRRFWLACTSRERTVTAIRGGCPRRPPRRCVRCYGRMNGTSWSARVCTAPRRAGVRPSRAARVARVRAAAAPDPTDPTRARGTPGRRVRFTRFSRTRARRWPRGFWPGPGVERRRRWLFSWTTTTAGASAARVPGRFRRDSRSVVPMTPPARGSTSLFRATRRRARCPRRCWRRRRGRVPGRGRRAVRTPPGWNPWPRVCRCRWCSAATGVTSRRGGGEASFTRRMATEINPAMHPVARTSRSSCFA